MSAKKPSGGKFVRNKNKYTFMWTRGAKYTAQQLQYRYRTSKKTTGWLKVGSSSTINKNASEISVVIDSSSIKWVQFRVKGKKGSWSGWYESKKRELFPPSKPKLSSELVAEDSTKFSWEHSESDTDWKPFTKMEFQTAVVENCDIKDGSKVAQLTGATKVDKTTDSSVTYQESGLANTSKTRWVRMRSVGVAGASDWVYIKYTYASPNQVSNVVADANTNEQGYFVNVSWDTSITPKNPTDNVVVKWAMEKPARNLECASGISWNDGKTLVSQAASNSASIAIDDLLDDDQCLFIKVDAFHDSYPSYGYPVLADYGKPKKPSSLNVTGYNNDNFLASITVDNESEIPDAKVAIIYRTADDPVGHVVGVTSEGNGSKSLTVSCPDWTGKTKTFSAFCFVGNAQLTDGNEYELTEDESINESKVYFVKNEDDTYSVVESPDVEDIGEYYEIVSVTSGDVYSITPYAGKELMKSDLLEDGGTVPVAPSDFTVLLTETPDTVMLSWSWAWREADSAEISWADHSDAWESTEEPSTFIVGNTNQGKWRISGLETGKTWYFRLRLLRSDSDETTYGDYTEIVSKNLSSAPMIPTLRTSPEGVANVDTKIKAHWGYSSTDGSEQMHAEIYTCTVSAGVVTVGDFVAESGEEQSIVFTPAECGWEQGDDVMLILRVASKSGALSGWSKPVALHIVEALTCQITSTSLEVQQNVYTDYSLYELCLTDMPLTVSVSGGDAGVTLVIERAEDYHKDRPDESVYDGFEGESIVSLSGDGSFEISQDDLVGQLDDTAAYRLVARTKDSYGQTAEATTVTVDGVTYDRFIVKWDEQAVTPSGDVQIIGLVASITPEEPQDANDGDTVDIYRLSADKPQLIYKAAQYGQTIIDPYPTLGNFCGYRLVCITENGDYSTEDNEIAWIDIEDIHVDTQYRTIIDFGGDTIGLLYNIDVSNQWEKEFTATRYLGGSVVGDWNASVGRSSSVSGVMITLINEDEIRLMRRLAAYTGICHVRTNDGSSYSADVQVSESHSHDKYGQVANFTLAITRVDNQALDGVDMEDYDGLE